MNKKARIWDAISSTFYSDAWLTSILPRSTLAISSSYYGCPTVSSMILLEFSFFPLKAQRMFHFHEVR